MSPWLHAIELIQLAHEAGDHVQRWRDLLERLVQSAGASWATLTAQRALDGALMGPICVGRAAREPLAQRAHQRWLSDQAAASGPGYHLVRGAQVNPSGSPQDQDALLAFELTAQGHLISVEVGWPPERPGSPHQLEFLGLVLPQVLGALGIAARIEQLEREAQQHREAAQRACFGIIWVDESRQVLWANAYAEQIFARADALMVCGGVLRACDPKAEAALEAASRDARGQRRSCSLALTRAPGQGRTLELLLSPLAPGRLWPHEGTWIMVADPLFVEEQVAERLQGLYGLTLTEAEVLQWLISGLSTEQIATTLDSSILTVRTHIKRVMKKLDVHSQVELMGILHRGLMQIAS